MLISESKDFIVSSASLKEIRTFSKDAFAKRNIPQELKDDLVLAITEASQNIVKHAYKGQATTDKMKVKILFRDNEIEIGFFDTGLPAVPENIHHRKLDDIKPGGLGTFFIKKIMDEVIFRKDKKGWVNHLVLTKKI
jgi:anti-sigma regulatory factor (Ser/Thr protein kinase)